MSNQDREIVASGLRRIGDKTVRRFDAVIDEGVYACLPLFEFLLTLLFFIVFLKSKARVAFSKT
jgi:hypothetical protein